MVSISRSILIVCLIGGTASFGSPIDPSGKWKVSFSGPKSVDGPKTVGSILLDLKVDGNTVIGVVTIGAWPGEAPITNGKLEGNRITFTATGNRTSTTGIPTCKFDVTVQGDEMSLTMTVIANAGGPLAPDLPYEYKGGESSTSCALSDGRASLAPTECLTAGREARPSESALPSSRTDPHDTIELSEDLLHRDVRLPDERSRFGKGRRHADRAKATRKSRRPKKPSWSSTTPAAFAIRPSRKSSIALISSSATARARPSPCWDASRSRKARRFSKRRRTSAWCAVRPATTSCREMLVQLEAGNRRVTGLSLDTEDTFDTPLTRRDNPHRAYITIIEGCDKSCAYCVVPFTRGPERSRTSASVIREASEIAAAGLQRDSIAGTEREQLSRSFAGRLGFRDAARRSRDACPASAAFDSPPRIRAISSKASSMRSMPIHALCNHVHLPVQSGSTRVLDAMQRLYTRDEYMRRIDWMKSARRPIAITTDIIVGFPGETRSRFRGDAGSAGTSGIRFDVQLQVFAPPEHIGAGAGRSDSRRRENPAAGDRAGAAAQHSDSPQCGLRRQRSRSAWWKASTKPPASGSGGRRRTRLLNFLSVESGNCETNQTSLLGAMLTVRVTRAGPNSLAGEYAG